jgi:hypothetical protein
MRGVSSEDADSRDVGGKGATLPIVWRVGRAGLTIAWTSVAASALVILVVTAWVLLWPDADKADGGIVAAPFALTIALLWRAAIHPSAEATEHGLIVHNPLETVTISWNDVVDATAGYDGVTIRRRGGRPTTIWAVQKSNVSTWRRKRTRADEVASTIRQLAAARAALVDPAPVAATRTPTQRDDVEPIDAFRAPLRFPWRMTRVEAAVVGSLRYSYSPLLSAASATLFGVLGLFNLAVQASDQWNMHLLHERGVVVHATVLDVPGQVKVVWPAIAPTAIFLDAGHHPASAYPVGSNVDVLSDPQHPTRAAIVGVTPDVQSTVAGFALGLGALLLASGYAKWARWLAVAAANQPPSHIGRHLSGPRH